MENIVKSPLELALELSLESIGCPLSERRYFFQAAMDDFLEAREIETKIKAKGGEELYKKITYIRDTKKLTGEERLIQNIMSEVIFYQNSHIRLLREILKFQIMD